MKQPNIKLFGETYKVKVIEYDNDGQIERIVYQKSLYSHKTVFKSDTAPSEHSVTTMRKIDKPTRHPYQDCILAPNLEALLC